MDGQKRVQHLMQTVGVRVDCTQRSSVHVRVKSPQQNSVNVSVRYCDSDSSSSSSSEEVYALL